MNCTFCWVDVLVGAVSAFSVLLIQYIFKVINFKLKSNLVSYRYKDISPSQIRDGNTNYYLDVKPILWNPGLLIAEGMSNYFGIPGQGTRVIIKFSFKSSEFSIAEGLYEWLETSNYEQNNGINEIGHCMLFFDIQNRRLKINFYPNSSLGYKEPYSGWYEIDDTFNKK